jgi:hypothetical protein
VRLWHTRLGALVALIVLVAAPSARAACAVRCADPARPAAAPRDAAAASGHRHAHHHGHAAEAPPPALAPDAAVRDTRCGPADSRGCLVLRATTAASAARLLQDGVALAALATIASPVVPPAAVRPSHRTPPIRPPGPTASLLPLRI